MTDVENDDRKTPRAKTHEEIAELIRSAWRKTGVSGECELCRSTNWLIPTTKEFDSGILMLTSSGGFDPLAGAGLQVYILSCSNCGNTRIFNSEIIADKAVSAGQPPESEQ